MLRNWPLLTSLNRFKSKKARWWQLLNVKGNWIKTILKLKLILSMRAISANVLILNKTILPIKTIKLKTLWHLRTLLSALKFQINLIYKCKKFLFIFLILWVQGLGNLELLSVLNFIIVPILFLILVSFLNSRKAYCLLTIYKKMRNLLKIMKEIWKVQKTRLLIKKFQETNFHILCKIIYKLTKINLIKANIMRYIKFH